MTIKQYIVKLLLFCPIIWVQAGVCQLKINEVCLRNSKIITDQNNQYSDWVEIYNKGEAAINLGGYSLSDNLKKPKKWVFPSQVLKKDQLLLVFASGNNVNGKELHASFKLSFEETLYLFNPNGSLEDSIHLTEFDENISLGYRPDGGGELFVFSKPTPGQFNNKGEGLRRLPEVNFSLLPGRYGESVSLELSGIENAVIRYTLDGSVPTEKSSVYQSRLVFDKTVCIRTKAFMDGYLPSHTSTNSYIVNKKTTLPIISIAVPPQFLWTDSAGIFVKGPNASPDFPYRGANFWKDWEVPAHVEFFEKGKELGFKQAVGMKVHGGSISRTRPQKSVRFLSKKKYGHADINYKLFEDKPIKSFKKFVLRNSGGDFNLTMFRDGMIQQHIAEENFNVDGLAYRPLVVYINGDYWGLMNMREKIDVNYVAENHGVKAQDVILLEEDSSEIQGDFEVFETLYEFIMTTDINNEESFKLIEDEIDIESYVDYFLTELYVKNIDWPGNNLKFWKTTDEDSKWRYMLFDLDATFNFMNYTHPDYNFLDSLMGKDTIRFKHARVLDRLLDNTGFRHYFINRYADILNTTFTTENFIKRLEKVKSHIEPEMEAHFKRWPGSSVDEWNEYIEENVVTWMHVRPDLVRKHIIRHFKLEDRVKLELEVFPKGAGEIYLNTIKPGSQSWSGVYFKDIPVNLDVKANSFHKFSYWVIDKSFEKITIPNLKNFKLEKDEKLIAVFDSEGQNVLVNVQPNPFVNLEEINLMVHKKAKLHVKLYDIFGKTILDYGQKLYKEGLNFLEVSGLDLSQGFYYLSVSGEGVNEVVKLVCAKQ